MNKKDEFAINWMNNPEKDVVKEPEAAEKKVSEKIKKKLKEEEEQKKRDAEIKAKEKERLAKNTPVSGLNFANFKSIGQERVDEKARKDREAHDEGERRKAKAIAEELVSANLVVNSKELADWIHACVGNRNFDVVFEQIRREDCHNTIRREGGDIKIYLYSGGWRAKEGVWDIRHTAELAKEALTESGFKTGEIKNYDRNYERGGYCFELDLTSMFKEK